MNGIFAIEFDGVVAAQYQASSREEALDHYAVALGFVDYSAMLDRVPIHERHRITAIAPEDEDYWDQTVPPKCLDQRK